MKFWVWTRGKKSTEAIWVAIVWGVFLTGAGAGGWGSWRCAGWDRTGSQAWQGQQLVAFPGRVGLPEVTSASASAPPQPVRLKSATCYLQLCKLPVALCIFPLTSLFPHVSEPVAPVRKTYCGEGLGRVGVRRALTIL